MGGEISTPVKTAQTPTASHESEYTKTSAGPISPTKPSTPGVATHTGFDNVITVHKGPKKDANDVKTNQSEVKVPALPLRRVDRGSVAATCSEIQMHLWRLDDETLERQVGIAQRIQDLNKKFTEQQGEVNKSRIALENFCQTARDANTIKASIVDIQTRLAKVLTDLKSIESHIPTKTELTAGIERNVRLIQTSDKSGSHKTTNRSSGAHGPMSSSGPLITITLPALDPLTSKDTKEESEPSSSDEVKASKQITIPSTFVPHLSSPRELITEEEALRNGVPEEKIVLAMYEGKQKYTLVQPLPDFEAYLDQHQEWFAQIAFHTAHPDVNVHAKSALKPTDTGAASSPSTSATLPTPVTVSR